MIRARLVFALCLASAPAWAAPAPAVSFAAFDEAYAHKDWEAAADAAWAVVADPQAKASHGAAWAHLGDALTEDKRPYAGFLAWCAAVEADGSQLKALAPKLIPAAAEFGEDRRLAHALLGNDLSSVDADTRSALAFLAARERVQSDQLGEALKRIAQIDSSSLQYPRGEALRGIIANQQGRPAEALAPLLTAEAAATRLPEGDREAFLDTVEMNLARTYYAAGNFGRAILYFSRIERTAPQWPEAQFERAWAQFRLDDMGGTLALIQNHQSPFLSTGWYPEAGLLRIYALFLLCRFTNAQDELTIYKQTWEPIAETLAEGLAQTTAPQAFADMRSVSEHTGTPRLPLQTLSAFAAEERTVSALTAVRRAEQEAEKLGNAKNPASAAAKDFVLARRDQIVADEGARVIRRATAQKTQLDGFLSNLVMTKIDIDQFELMRLEKAAASGKLPEMGDKIGELRKAKRAGFHVWDFEGEYWADELGYYAYSVRTDCPEGMRTTE